MNSAITVAIITACVTAVGWLVTNYLSQRREQQKAKAEATLRYVERQLEELYGPLVALIYEGRQVFQELLRSLGRDYVFGQGLELPDDELKTWLFWTENSFLPRNRQIRDLLTSKPHLVDGAAFSESYIAFFLHESSWRVHHERWLKEQVAYDWHSSVNWPLQFEREVIETFKVLKNRHSELLGMLQRW
jgi:hypothetical protein